MFVPIQQETPVHVFGRGGGGGGGLSAMYRLAALAKLQGVCILSVILTNSMYDIKISDFKSVLAAALYV